MSTSLILSQQQPAPFLVPAAIEQALRQGAALAISLSGGKDSQALLELVAPWFRARGFTGQLVAIHADLGRAEWEQTPAFVQQLCERVGVPLIIERRTKGDLVQRMTAEAERTKDTGQQFWPSSGARYCTSDMKRGPIQRAQRRLGELVVCCQGLRAEESAGRARQPVVEVERALTASSLEPFSNLAKMSPAQALFFRQPGQRVALNWRPLLNFTTAQVWQACGTSTTSLAARQRLHRIGATTSALAGWVGHPAYVLGNQRLSCALCVLGSKNDLLNGANHNPTTYGLYLELEVLGGSTFKHNQSLFDLPVSGRAAEVRDEVLEKIEAGVLKQFLKETGHLAQVIEQLGEEVLP